MRLRFGLCFIAAILSGSAAYAQVVANRYILELNEEPLAAMWKQRRSSEGFASQRARVVSEQSDLRRQLNRGNIKIRGSVDTVANAIFVESSDRALLESLPGVKAVRPVRLLRPKLDHVNVLMKFPDAWAQVGGSDKAGAGMKIGMIDTGLDVYHIAFQDPSVTPPDGFPIFSPAANRTFTTNKVIVARAYDGGTIDDFEGHGTETTMIAAGLYHNGPLGKMGGAAPKAFIGVYKAFDENVGGFFTDDIISALDDAVKDGMDVVNMSLSGPATALADDLDVAPALNRTMQAGVIVVAAAGNEGPDASTVGDVGSVPNVIAVGATQNDRDIVSPVIIVLPSTVLRAEPASNSEGGAAINGQMIDVSSVDRTGTACSPFPANSLSGKIALIQRGTCTFEDKFNNAQSGGAIAAVVIDNTSSASPLSMDVQAATLRGMGVTRNDGNTLKDNVALSPDAQYRLSFARTATLDPNVLADFSSIGPTPDTSIKPDLLTIGDPIVTAVSGTTPNDPTTSDYTVDAGTSFSSPIVAGAAAVLKQARPNLTIAQYRSLLINSASTFPANSNNIAVMSTGAGILNFPGALSATTAVSPATVSFGELKGSAVSRDLLISNLGTSAANLTITVKTRDSVMPDLSTSTLALDAGASQTIKVNWSNTSVSPGPYQGYFEITGGSGGTARVPYWTALRGKDVKGVSIVLQDFSGTVATTSDIYFRVVDASGLSLLDPGPDVSVVSGGGSVVRLALLAPPDNTGVYVARVRLGARAGDNVFKITVGGIDRLVTITGGR
jgi:subtilisin family serine protease